MDQLDLVQRVKTLIGRYKYVILIVAAGIFLMAMPSGQSQQDWQEPAAESAEDTDIREELESVLSQIQGVGKVRVMVTELSPPETVYQTDVDLDTGTDGSSQRSKTVIVSKDGDETGLIRTVTPPTFLGAVIVCQGGDIPSVRLAVSQAVAAVTGISTDRITVLKMK